MIFLNVKNVIKIIIQMHKVINVFYTKQKIVKNMITNTNVKIANKIISYKNTKISVLVFLLKIVQNIKIIYAKNVNKIIF